MVSPVVAADPSATDKDKPAPSNAAKDVSSYVGSETCKTCHEEIYNAWEKTPHWKTTLDKRLAPPNKVVRAAMARVRSTSRVAAIKRRYSF